MSEYRLSDKLLPAFYSFHTAIKKPFLYYVLKGGRGSSKSTHIAIELILRRMKHKSHAIAIRRWEKYNAKSTFEQLKWAIEYLGVGQFWKVKLSPLELTYTPLGTKILFYGADDPHKIKSIKTADYPITDTWINKSVHVKLS